MFRPILRFIRSVFRYEKTAPMDSACMRCILLWTCFILVALNLICNGFDRPVVYIFTGLICLVLLGVSLLLPRIRNKNRLTIAGAVLITLMGFVCLLSNENDGFQSLWFFLLPIVLLVQMGLSAGLPVCVLYGLATTLLFWGFPGILPNAYTREYRIYYPIFYWEFLLVMVAADLFYKSYRIRREQTEREMEAEVQATMDEAHKLMLSSVAAISQMIDEKDRYTSEHSRRVAQYSCIIAKHLEPDISEETLDKLYRSALLHDIGKIAVPDAILKKPGRLTNEEFTVMKEHTIWGAADPRRAGVPAPSGHRSQLPPRAVQRDWLPFRAARGRPAPDGLDHFRRRCARRHELRPLLPQTL